MRHCFNATVQRYYSVCHLAEVQFIADRLLGILVEAKRKGLILSVKPLIDQLIADSTFRVSPKLYELILTMAEKQA
ncbi:MAG: DUF3368 domain-containing protein [Phormidesmis sp.]